MKYFIILFVPLINQFIISSYQCTEFDSNLGVQVNLFFLNRHNNLCIKIKIHKIIK